MMNNLILYVVIFDIVCVAGLVYLMYKVRN